MGETNRHGTFDDRKNSSESTNRQLFANYEQPKRYLHGSTCKCGCEPKNDLANNRKIEVAPVIAGFHDSLKVDIKRDEDKYHTNVDALAAAGLKNPSSLLDAYIISNIVAKMEAGTEFFPKGTDKAVAGNCGKRVMPPKLRKKIFGLDFDGNDDVTKSTVDIIDYRDSVSYQGVMCCHGLWGCLPCARKISERRKNGLSLLLNSHFNKFGEDSITASLFTIPHGLGDDLEDINKRLLKAYYFMTQATAYKKFIKSLNGCGYSRNVEVTWAMVNGFHPHLHVLTFFEQPLSDSEVQFLYDTLFNFWTKALLKHGFTAPSREAFGCKLIPSTKAGIDKVAAYFSKPEADVNDADIMGYLKKHKKNVRGVTKSDGRTANSNWSIEHEMTKWHLKQAKNDGENFRYSMFDFPRGYAIAEANGDEESRKRFRALWLAYRKAFKGVRQLWTRHKHFKIKELEASDQELGEEVPEEKAAKVVYSIPFDVWLMVVYMGARGAVLESARLGGAARVIKTLEFIQFGYDCLPEDRRIFH